VGLKRFLDILKLKLLARPVTMLIPDERLQEEEVILNKIRKGEKVDHFETVRKIRPGIHITVSITVSPIKGWQGQYHRSFQSGP
jgi:hypothetical protein